MAEYEFKKQEQAYEVVPGVVFVDNSVSYDPVEKNTSKVNPFQSQRLMRGRELGSVRVDQQQEVLLQAISRGYKRREDPGSEGGEDSGSEGDAQFGDSE